MDTPRTNWPVRSGVLFVVGMLLGLIPMALLFLSISWTQICFRSCGGSSAQIATRQLASTLGSIGVWTWIAAAAIAIVLLFFRRLRPISYGLLIMVTIAPCTTVVGCVVRLPSPYG